MTRYRRPTHPAIAAIRSEAARVGWPLRFATDLDHDERHITIALGDEPFGWVLREDGTHIAPIASVGWNRPRLTCQMIADAFGPECRCYIWDGWSLTAYPTATLADERIADLAREYREAERAGHALWSARSDGECPPDCV